MSTSETTSDTMKSTASDQYKSLPNPTSELLAFTYPRISLGYSYCGEIKI